MSKDELKIDYSLPRAKQVRMVMVSEDAMVPSLLIAAGTTWKARGVPEQGRPSAEAPLKDLKDESVRSISPKVLPEARSETSSTTHPPPIYAFRGSTAQKGCQIQTVRVQAAAGHLVSFEGERQYTRRP